MSNRTNTTCLSPKNIMELFKEQVKRHPKKLAVGCQHETLTYEELEAKSSEIALNLMVNDLYKEEFVAVITKRQTTTIIGFLAALKAGGVYMPIDADYPEARITYMLKDSNCRFILGNPKDLSLSQEQKAKYQFIDLEAIQFDLNRTKQAPCLNLTDRHLAYLIYTSGTTGKPKGVLVEQKSIINLVKHASYADFKDIRLLQTGSLSFDASTFEIWGALLNGGYVYISDLDVLVNEMTLKQTIADLSINTMWLTSALYNHLITTDVTVFDGLSQLLIGGEALSTYHINKLLAHHPSITLINGYGPTETTTFATTLTISKPIKHYNVPIGQPIANTSVYIMTNGKLANGDAQGELFIGGPGVARGYLNAPALTAEKFIDNPFGEGKLYRTGDLARWLSDGNIDYLGRIDQQVKINGYRIELKEIEIALKKISGIEDAIVLQRNEHLHAYLKNPTCLSHEVITLNLKAILPNYMIPTCYVDLESFPVTTNGKVNEDALPNINFHTPVAYTSAKNHIEAKLVDAYAQALNLQPSTISTSDNFFKLGGTSIKLLQAFNLLKNDFDISIKNFYSDLSIAELSALISDNVEVSLNTTEHPLLLPEFTAKKIINKEALPQPYLTALEKIENLYIQKDNNQKNLLLTGATGFLGAHLLLELLETSNNTIYTLIRGKDTQDAKQRLKDICKFYFPTHDVLNQYAHRIIICKGDISVAHLGLTEESHLELAQNIDLIINVASNVKHYGIYDEFYRPNVLGIKHLIDLQELGKTKKIVHCSTISLGSGYIPDMSEFSFTEDTLSNFTTYESVYLKTKAEAESLLIEARKRGLSNSIIRFGNLQANTKTGKFQINKEDNAFFSLIQGLLHLGIAPKTDLQTEYTPIDYAATATAKIITSTIKTNEIYHVYNPYPISVKKLLQSFIPTHSDLALKLVEPETLYQQLFDILKKENADEKLLKFSLHLGLYKTHNIQTKFTIHSEKTNAILKKLDFKWRELGEKDFERIGNNNKN